MNIAFVEIQNFRKLKACRVEMTEEETIFVGKDGALSADRIVLPTATRPAAPRPPRTGTKPPVSLPRPPSPEPTVKGRNAWD